MKKNAFVIFFSLLILSLGFFGGCSFELKELSEIGIVVREGAKTTFDLGEDFTFDYENIDVTAIYDDNSFSYLPIQELQVDSSAYKKDSTGNYEIIVTYQTHSSSFYVQVVNTQATDLTVSFSEDFEDTFSLNTPFVFDYENIDVLAHFGDGSIKKLSQSEFQVDSSNYKGSEPGRYEILISYNSLSCSFFVTVENGEEELPEDPVQEDVDSILNKTLAQLENDGQSGNYEIGGPNNPLAFIQCSSDGENLNYYIKVDEREIKYEDGQVLYSADGEQIQKVCISKIESNEFFKQFLDFPQGVENPLMYFYTYLSQILDSENLFEKTVYQTADFYQVILKIDNQFASQTIPNGTYFIKINKNYQITEIQTETGNYESSIDLSFTYFDETVTLNSMPGSIEDYEVGAEINTENYIHADISKEKSAELYYDLNDTFNIPTFNIYYNKHNSYTESPTTLNNNLLEYYLNGEKLTTSTPLTQNGKHKISVIYKYSDSLSFRMFYYIYVGFDNVLTGYDYAKTALEFTSLQTEYTLTQTMFGENSERSYTYKKELNGTVYSKYIQYSGQTITKNIEYIPETQTICDHISELTQTGKTYNDFVEFSQEQMYRVDGNPIYNYFNVSLGNFISEETYIAFNYSYDNLLLINSQFMVDLGNGEELLNLHMQIDELGRIKNIQYSRTDGTQVMNIDIDYEVVR